MDVAHDVVDVLFVGGIAGVVGLGHLVDGLGDGHRRGQRGQLGAGHHDVGDRLVAESQRAAHEGLLHLVDVPHLLAGLEDHAQLFLGVGQFAIGRRLDAEDLQDAGRGDVHEPGERPSDQVEPAERQSDDHRGLLGLADGEVLGHQLAEDDRDEGHEHEGEDGRQGPVHGRDRRSW